MLKKIHVGIVFGLISALGMPRPVFATTSAKTDKEVKTYLDQRFMLIEDEARKARHWGGGITLGLGIASGVGAAFAAGSSDPVWRTDGAIVLGVAGGLMAIGGALILALPTDLEKIPQKYRALPEGTSEEVSEKAAAGQAYLSAMAGDARRARITGGVMNMGLGVGEIALYLTRNNNSTFSAFNNTVWLYLGVFSIGSGIASLLIESPMEKAQNDFLSWKDSGSNTLTSMRLGVLPLEDGAGLVASLNF